MKRFILVLALVAVVLTSLAFMGPTVGKYKTSVYTFIGGAVASGYSTGFDTSWDIDGKTFRGMAIPVKGGVLYDLYHYSDMATEAHHAMILVTPFTISYVWNSYVYDKRSHMYKLQFHRVKRGETVYEALYDAYAGRYYERPSLPVKPYNSDLQGFLMVLFSKDAYKVKSSSPYGFVYGSGIKDTYTASEPIRIYPIVVNHDRARDYARVGVALYTNGNLFRDLSEGDYLKKIYEVSNIMVSGFLEFSVKDREGKPIYLDPSPDFDNSWDYNPPGRPQYQKKSFYRRDGYQFLDYAEVSDIVRTPTLTYGLISGYAYNIESPGVVGHWYGKLYSDKVRLDFHNVPVPPAGLTECIPKGEFFPIYASYRDVGVGEERVYMSGVVWLHIPLKLLRGGYMYISIPTRVELEYKVVHVP